MHVRARLLSAKLLDFLDVAMPRFYRAYLADLFKELHKLPQWLQDLIRPLERRAEEGAPKAFELALSWVESVQKEYNTAGSTALYDEMDAIAHGKNVGMRQGIHRFSSVQEPCETHVDQRHCDPSVASIRQIESTITLAAALRVQHGSTIRAINFHS